MSDQNTVTDQSATPTPNAGAVDRAATPNAGAAAESQAQPFAVFPDAKSFSQKVSREARKLMNEQAKAAGFDDWQHMQDSLAALRQPQTATPTPENPQEGQAATPAPTAAPVAPDEAKRLRMALSVASDLNLPTALVARLQGETTEEMTADANRLLALFQQSPRGPGIPPAPKQNQPVTFTRAQLQNPAFVREHQAEIMQAAREGRIVDS